MHGSRRLAHGFSKQKEPNDQLHPLKRGAHAKRFEGHTQRPPNAENGVVALILTRPSLSQEGPNRNLQASLPDVLLRHRSYHAALLYRVNDDGKVELSSDTLASLDRIYHGEVVDDVLKRNTDETQPALTTERPITYSLWYGGCGVFAHAMNDTNCASYFDRDSRSRTKFSSRNPGAHVAADLEAILKNLTEFVEATESVDYIDATPPCTAYTRGGSKLGLRVDSGKQMLRFFDLLSLLPDVPMVFR